MLHGAIFLAPCQCGNNRCVSRCKKDFTCTNPFLQPAMQKKFFVVSCKESRKYPQLFVTLWDKLLRVICHSHLVTQFYKNEPIRAKNEKHIGNMWHPLCNLRWFSVVIVALQVARRIAPCNMAFTFGEGYICFCNIPILQLYTFNHT